MIIALTGGIAAGKSTVRTLLAARPGLETFDADACVHHLLDADAEVASAIRSAFGPSFLQSEGTPDRAALRERVFRDPEARRTLEDLLHPRVRGAWQEQRSRCAEAGRDFLADIPLLYETNAQTLFDAVVVVACSSGTQLARLADRGLRPSMAQAMLASQLPIGQKVAKASFVIWNDGSLAALGWQVEAVARQLFPG